jgi:hypothetical protein
LVDENQGLEDAEEEGSGAREGGLQVSRVRV